MKFREYLKEHIVYLDGGMGTVLQSAGLKPGESPERWNLSHPEIITNIHKGYYDAGSNVVCTNTFGANLFKFSEEELEEIIKRALEHAKLAREQSVGEQEKYIALDLGPSGKLLEPLGDLAFEEAVCVFAKTVELGVKYGADLILIETMNDSYETKAALLAAKEHSTLPVIVTNAYSENSRLMTGATATAMVAMLEGLGADAIGANCSLGPKQLRKVAEELVATASVPVVLKPNAGLPKEVEGKTVFDVNEEEFAKELQEIIELGVRVVGGCCGTTASYIKCLVEKTKDAIPKPLTEKTMTMISSFQNALILGKAPVLIGERINPTGKKRLKQAILDKDIAYILSEGLGQQEKGVQVLDVNVGIPDINEIEVLKEVVYELQSVVDVPLQIDSSNVEAMEAALRIYNGKAMINSVNGKEESMNRVFPLVKKYGAVVVALTLDEEGIPNKAEKRVEIAKKILEKAKEYGIAKKDIIFDTLAMTVSVDHQAANETLKALHKIKNELACHTILGVSNVSFGLPARDALNAAFFTMALESGLSAAIMNPYSLDMMKMYYSYCALKGYDENFTNYIEHANQFVTTTKVVENHEGKTTEVYQSELQKAIGKGLKESASGITKELLKTIPPLDIIQNDIIPALDFVGAEFEQKRVYLPQLLMSAEAAQAAFESIKAFMLKTEMKREDKASFVIATVKGDIHDIGKNIVKLLLSNYGFHVVDLGRDVPPEKIVETVIQLHAPLVGLSALMTTTVPAMEETIRELKKQAPWCHIVVGGAVLTQEYADQIGADKYAKDAMESVRYAEKIVGRH